MKILFSWLKDYVDIECQPSELVDKLFGAGFEVEETIYLGQDIEKVVVGEVTSIEKYEGTHLYICHVDCGGRKSPRGGGRSKAPRRNRDSSAQNGGYDELRYALQRRGTRSE